MSNEVRILHTADIHLDSPLKSLALISEDLQAEVQAATRTALEKIIDLAIEETVSAVLISGDLFDSAEKSAKTAAFLMGQFDRLRDEQIEVFYIKGNHDAGNPLIQQFDFPSNVHVFDGHGGKKQLGETNIWVHGVSFSGRHAEQSLLPKFNAPVENATNIAMLHTSLAGAQGHDNYAPCSVSELITKGFDYWALGHVHKRQVHSDAPWIVMPGMPQGRDIGESGSKSVSLLRILNGAITVDEIPISQVEFNRVELDIGSAGNDEELRDLIKQKLLSFQDKARREKQVLRFLLQGQSKLYWQILRDQRFWVQTLNELANGIEGIWIEKCEFDISPPQTTEASDGQEIAAVDELHSIMLELSGEELNALETGKMVEDVLSLLSPEQRRELMPDEDRAEQLKASFTAKGISRIIARMKGVASQ